MAIRVTCDSCNTTFSVADTLAGKKVRCRKCNEPLVLPGTAAPKSPAKTESIKAKSDPARPRPVHDLTGEDEEPFKKKRRPDDTNPPSRGKSSKRRDDDDDDEVRPSRKQNRKKPASGVPMPLLIGGGAGVGVLVLVIIVCILVFGRGGGNSTDNNNQVAQQNDQKQQNANPLVPPVNKPNVEPVELENPAVANPVDEKPPERPIDNPAKIPDPVPQPPNPNPETGRKVDPLPLDAEWQVTPDTAATIKAKPITMTLPGLEGLDRLSNVVFSRGKMCAAVGYSRPFKGTRVLLCDLDKGSVVGDLEIPKVLMALVAVSDDASEVVLGTKDGAEVWSIAGKKKLTLKDASERQRDITRAFYLDQKRLLTMSSRGKLIAWDTESGKQIYYTTTQAASVPALSANRKLLACVNGKDLVMVDAQAGKTLAVKPGPATFSYAMLSFSPDGKSLACSIAGGNLYVWDVATGELLREMSSKLSQARQIDWVSESHILLAGNTLFDLDMQVRYWDFQVGFPGKAITSHLGGLTWFASAGRTKDPVVALIGTPLPTPTALAALEKAAADPSYIVLKEGTTVKLNLADLPDPAQKQKVGTALEAALAKIGIKVGPNGTIDLVARIVPGEDREIGYYEIPPRKPKDEPFKPGKGLPPGTEIRSANIRQLFSRLEFVLDGKVIWESVADNLPERIKLEPGESVQQHLDKLSTRPNYAFFETVHLPRRLIRTGGSGVLGSTRVTPKGLE